MDRKTLKMLVFALIAAFALPSIAEAAPKTVRHRPRHSSRVSSGASATARQQVRKKKAPTTRSHTRPQANHRSTQTQTGKRPAVKRNPTTKPR